MYKVEGYVYRKTGLRFRGQLVAGTVAGLGVAQMALYGISLEMLPGPVLSGSAGTSTIASTRNRHYRENLCRQATLPRRRLSLVQATAGLPATA